MSAHVIKSPRTKENFLVLSNEILTADISYRAMGLVAYILSREEDWTILDLRRVDLGKNSYLGRDAIYSILNELLEAGFVSRERFRCEGGKYAGITYYISDRAFEGFEKK